MKRLYVPDQAPVVTGADVLWTATGSPIGQSPSPIKGRESDATIVDYLSDNTVWVSNDWQIVQFKLNGSGDERISGLVEDRTTIEINEKSTFATHSKIAFDTQPQPVFHKQFDILTEDLRKHIDEGYKVYNSLEVLELREDVNQIDCLLVFCCHLLC